MYWFRVAIGLLGDLSEWTWEPWVGDLTVFITEDAFHVGTAFKELSRIRPSVIRRARGSTHCSIRRRPLIWAFFRLYVIERLDYLVRHQHAISGEVRHLSKRGVGLHSHIKLLAARSWISQTDLYRPTFRAWSQISSLNPLACMYVL